MSMSGQCRCETGSYTRWFLQQRLQARREWFAGNSVGAVERYGLVLASRAERDRARAALAEIARLVDEIGAIDPDFKAARRRLRARISELLFGSQSG
jgi:hypothetical protein